MHKKSPLVFSNCRSSVSPCIGPAASGTSRASAKAEERPTGHITSISGFSYTQDISRDTV